VLNYKKIKLS